MKPSKGIMKNVHNLIQQAKNEMGVEQAFVSDLCSAIVKLDEVRKPSKCFYPSQMNCLRLMYYQVTGTEVDPQDKSESLISIGNSGTDRHERIQTAISQMQNLGMGWEWVDVDKYVEENCQGLGTVVVEKQGHEYKCFNTSLNLRFKCDGILKYKGEYYIFEFKTETMMKNSRRNSVDDSHISQACCYSTCFGIDKVLWLYECRDTMKKIPFLVNITPNMIEKNVKQKVNKVNEYVLENVPPPKCEDKRSCTYCSYKSQCARDGA